MGFCEGGHAFLVMNEMQRGNKSNTRIWVGEWGVWALFQHSHISWYNVTFPSDYHSALFAKGKPGEEVFLGDNRQVNWAALHLSDFTFEF